MRQSIAITIMKLLPLYGFIALHDKWCAGAEIITDLTKKKKESLKCVSCEILGAKTWKTWEKHPFVNVILILFLFML